MLWAATLAPDTALSQCSMREELVVVEHMGGARDVAGDEDVVGHHPVDVESAAAGVAGDPPEAGARPAPSSHSMLRIDPSEATTTSTSSVVPSESCARRTWPAASPSSAIDRDTCAQVDPRVALHLGGDVADDAAERPDQRRISALCDSDVQP